MKAPTKTILNGNLILKRQELDPIIDTDSDLVVNVCDLPNTIDLSILVKRLIGSQLDSFFCTKIWTLLAESDYTFEFVPDSPKRPALFSKLDFACEKASTSNWAGDDGTME